MYKFKKVLCGLKQAPRVWNSRIDDYFIQNDFTRCPYEHALYLKTNSHGDILLVCLYVDDLIFIRKIFQWLKNSSIQWRVDLK